MKRVISILVVVIILGLLFNPGAGQAQLESAKYTKLAEPMGTAFTYQGYLSDSVGPVTGSCDFQFTLFGSSSGSDQVGSTLYRPALPVSEGYFTVADLDFGSGVFIGEARWLQVAVCCPAGTGAYQVLSPRQELMGSPYALSAPWSGLVDVPGDLADGDDDTLYTPGSGLLLNGAQFSVIFAGSGTATTASRSDHQHDPCYVNEGQTNSVSSSMIEDGTLLFADLNYNGCGTGQIIK